MANTLQSILTECADELSALPALADVTVLTEDRGDLDNLLAKALAMTPATGKAGAAVLLLCAGASVRGATDFGPVFREVKIQAICAENTVITRGSRGRGLSAL